MQFFRLYLGLYNHALPDVLASIFDDTRMEGSRVHMSPSCKTVAVSFSNAQFSEEDPGVFTGLSCMFRQPVSRFT